MMLKKISMLIYLCCLSLMAQAQWLKVTTENLPDKLVAEQSYKDVRFTLTNQTNQSIPIVISDIKTPKDFPGTGWNPPLCNTTLAPGASCSLIGPVTYLPLTTGTAEWSFRIRVANVDIITEKITKTVSASGLVGKIVSDLPANSYEGNDYPLEFSFSNTSGVTLNNLRATLPKLQGLSLTNNCKNTLAAKTSCTLTGDYTPPSGLVGKPVSITVSMQDSNRVVSLTSKTTIVNIAVTGTVTKGLPTTAAVGKPHSIEFTFTNQNKGPKGGGTAAGIVVKVPNIKGLAEKSNDCGKTLNAGASCTYKAVYTPPVEDLNHAVGIPVTLSYKQGADVQLNTTTTVVDGLRALVTAYYNTVTECTVNPTTWGFSACANADTGGGNFHNPVSITLNAEGTLAFVVNNGNNPVTQCNVNPITGHFSECHNAGGTNFSKPHGITLNAAGTLAFVVNNGNNTVTRCKVDSETGAFGKCDDTGGTNFSAPQGITLKAYAPDTTRAFVVNNGNNTITQCNVDPAGTFSNCTDTKAGSLTQPKNIVLNAEGTQAFVTNYRGNTVTQCTIDAKTGAFSKCAPDTGGGNFNRPAGITLNAAGTRAFVTNQYSSTVTQCTVEPTTGAFSKCADTGAKGLPFLPTSIVLLP